MPWTRKSVSNSGDAADELAAFLTRANRAGAVTPNAGNTGDGTVFGASADTNAVVETWTLVCTTNGGNGVGIFSVTGSVSGAQAAATVGVPYFNGLVSFTIIGGTVDFTTATPDDFTFGVAADTPTWEEQRGNASTTRIGSIQPGAVTADPGNTGGVTIINLLTINGAVDESWTVTAIGSGPQAAYSVVGSVSGGHTAANKTIAYDNGLVSFLITGSPGNSIGDFFTFDTTYTPDTVIPDAANTGDGTVGSMVGIASESATEETWTLNCTTGGGAGVAVFDVDGSVSGDAGSDIVSDVAYDNGRFSLLITAGGAAFVSGDKYTFTQRQFEYILKGIGDGSDEIYVGYKEVTDASTYYNWNVQGFTGYIDANLFETQPAYEAGIYHVQTDGTFDILIIENSRRFIVVPIIGTIYAQLYLGWVLPTATPSQWDYPIFKGGDSDDPAELISSTGFDHRSWWKTPDSGDMYNNSVWDTNSDVWPYADYISHKTEGDDFPLLPVTVLNDTSTEEAIYGEADGCFYMDADNGAITVADSVVTSDEFYFIVQDVFRVGNGNLMALRLE